MNAKRFAVCVLGCGVLLVARPGFATPYKVDETTIAAFGTLDQTQVGPNSTVDPTLNNFCAPTATMNSFTFLSNAYGGIYDDLLMGGTGSWLDAAKLLAGSDFMNTDRNTGTSEINWVDGKYNYIQKYAPGTTFFEGMDAIYRGALTWVQHSDPTAAFLLRMLQQGEDVEIGLSPTSAGIGHVMTLSSIDWNDANSNLLFDAGDTLSIDGYDPAGNGTAAASFNYTLKPGTLMTFDGGRYNGYVLDAALAESPIPEPSTLVLLGSGVIGFVLRRHRKARPDRPLV